MTVFQLAIYPIIHQQLDDFSDYITTAVLMYGVVIFKVVICSIIQEQSQEFSCYIMFVVLHVVPIF